MKVAIHQPQYLPWLGYLAKWDAADLFVVLDVVQYEKNGWQNRNRVKTRDGVRWLTVPVHAPLGTPIAAVEIDSSRSWPARHLRTIEGAYARAPGLALHREALRDFYARPWTRLSPLAVDSARWLAGALGITTPLRLASELLPAPAPATATGRLVALCRAAGADTYLAGEHGGDYMDLAEFAAAGIGVLGQRYAHPVYHQAHGDFVPRLSALDLLLTAGPGALAILREGNRWIRLLEARP
jgi:hypothetical protein